MNTVALPSANVEKCETVAITGSKGGVGKSNLVLNLAVSMGRWGKKVLLVDGDLGLANLDVLCGLMPKRTVEHLVNGEARLSEVLIDGPAGVQILPAASGVPALARLDGLNRQRLLAALAEGCASVDTVLVDTGAGLGEATLALQLASSRVIVVTTPEPTSMVDAYATLKVLWSADPGKVVDLVVNNVADNDEAVRVHEQIARASRHFLDRELGWLGPVFRDPLVVDAVRRQRSVMELYPDCPASRCYERIAMRITAERGANVPVHEYWERLLSASGEELPH